MNTLRTLLIAMLMATLPLQGLAAYMPATVCADAHAAHGHATEEHATADMPDHHHPAENEAADAAGGHSCCHHVVSAAVPSLITGIVETPPVLASRVSLLSTLFIPELPQRPPRA